MVHYALAGCLGAVIGLAGLRLVPHGEQSLGPASVTPHAQFGGGRTVLVVPPLGTLAAATHITPLTLNLTLAQLDFSRLASRLSSAGERDRLTAEIESDLRSLARSMALELLAGAAILGALAGALIPHRRIATILWGACGGAVGVGLLLGLTALSFDVAGFEEPRFSGALTRAPQVIEAVTQRIGSFDELRSRYETAAERLSDLLAVVAEPTSDPHTGSIAILHVSDIHSNPLGVEVAGQLARRFEVDAIIDTGDLTSFGQPIESRIGALIDDVGVPYLFVGGNHDSPANRRALARVSNVTLLENDTAEVSGLDILGWSDPTFTATNELSTEEANAIREAEASEVATTVQRLQPDVLAVHDERLAAEAIGEVPLVLAGHTHERDLTESDGTTTMVVGSTGATGLGSFTVDATLSYEAEVLYFRAGEVAVVDYVLFEGLSGDFTVERTNLESSGS
jgi:predicted phosphodiesterase